jgi:hypothetical protein
MMRGGGGFIGDQGLARTMRRGFLMRMARRRPGCLAGIAQALSEALRTRQQDEERQHESWKSRHSLKLARNITEAKSVPYETVKEAPASGRDRRNRLSHHGSLAATRTIRFETECDYAILEF